MITSAASGIKTHTNALSVFKYLCLHLYNAYHHEVE